MSEVEQLRDERDHWIGEAKRYERLYRWSDERATMWFDRMKTAEAAVGRVRVLVDKWDDDTGGRHIFWGAVPDLRRALEGREAAQNGAVSAEEGAGGSECHREDSGRESGAEDFTPPPAAYWSEGEPLPDVGRWHQHKSGGDA